MMRGLRFRLYRLRWWWRGITHRPGTAPVHVDLELASDCQLRCTMCPYGDADHPYTQRGMMPRDRAARAIDEAADLGVSSIKFQFRGEPGLNKDLERHVDHARRRGIVDRFINTNGLAMSRERIKRLARAGLTRLILSVDGASKATYEAIRVRANWEKLRQAFGWYVEAGHRVEVQMTAQPGNEHEVEAFRSLWPGASKITVKRVRARGTERAHCPQPYRRLVVAHDGIVFGCCWAWKNEFPVGRFPEQSLQEIWTGERMQQLRAHAKAGTGPCATCEVGEAWKR